MLPTRLPTSVIAVRSSAAGRGVATTATRLIAAFALRALGLNRLEILIPEVNVASQRVAQKAGAKFEGLLRNRLMTAGQMRGRRLFPLIFCWLTLRKHDPGAAAVKSAMFYKAAIGAGRKKEEVEVVRIELTKVAVGAFTPEIRQAPVGSLGQESQKRRAGMERRRGGAGVLECAGKAERRQRLRAEKI